MYIEGTYFWTHALTFNLSIWRIVYYAMGRNRNFVVKDVLVSKRHPSPTINQHSNREGSSRPEFPSFRSYEPRITQIAKVPAENYPRWDNCARTTFKNAINTPQRNSATHQPLKPLTSPLHGNLSNRKKSVLRTFSKVGPVFNCLLNLIVARRGWESWIGAGSP